MHQLIVLGNGFDLSCGLKSRFSDFYNNRTNGTNSIESIPENKRNVWDVIFLRPNKTTLYGAILRVLSLQSFSRMTDRAQG